MSLRRGSPVWWVRPLVPRHGFNKPHPTADTRIDLAEWVQSDLPRQCLGLRRRVLESYNDG
jgi:hypothetical protein